MRILGLEQDHEQPLAKAIVQTLKREFAEDSALGERARDASEDIMPEIRGKYYSLVEDKEGKQTLEKNYPPYNGKKNGNYFWVDTV